MLTEIFFSLSIQFRENEAKSTLGAGCDRRMCSSVKSWVPGLPDAFPGHAGPIPGPAGPIRGPAGPIPGPVGPIPGPEEFLVLRVWAEEAYDPRGLGPKEGGVKKE